MSFGSGTPLRVGLMRYEPPEAAPLTVGVLHLEPNDEAIRARRRDHVLGLGVRRA